MAQTFFKRDSWMSFQEMDYVKLLCKDDCFQHSSSNRFVNLYAFLIIALFFASRFSLLGIGQFSYTKITNKSNTLIDATPDALSLYVFPFRRLLVRCHMREKNWNVNQPISSRRHWPWSTPRVQRLTIADSRRRTDKSRLQIDRPWSGNMANCQWTGDAKCNMARELT